MAAVTAPARLIPVVPETEEWHAARREGITASEIAVLLGISPFDSPFNLYWKKLGTLPDHYDNDRLSLGRHCEPWVADRFAEAHPDLWIANGGLFGSTARPWAMATPDRLIYEAATPGHHSLCTCSVCAVDEPYPVAVWEGKTSGTYEGWGDDGTDEIPAYIRAQVLWQQDVMGVRAGYVSCLFLATQKTRHYEIGYDPADVKLMRARAVEFLARLKTGDPPPLDAHSATTGALRQLYPTVDDEQTATVPERIAEDYRWAHAQLAAAKEQAAQADNEVRDAMGDAKYAVDPGGQKVCSRSIYDRKGYWVEPTTIDKLNPPGKKTKP